MPNAYPLGFLRLLVLNMSATPFAVFLELNFARDKLAVLARPVVNPVTFRTRYSDELLLRHMLDFVTSEAS